MGRIDKADISTIIKNWQTLDNGEHPIVTKVYSNKKRKLFTTSLSSSPGKWDTETGRFKRNKAGNDLITEAEIRARRIADNIISTYGVFNMERFSKEFRKKAEDASFFRFAESFISELREQKRDGTADSYSDAMKKFRQFRKQNDINIADIEKKDLTGFMEFMRKSGQGTNGIGIYTRSVCAIYGRAVEQGFVPTSSDARDGLKIKKETTAKKALSKENMLRIVEARFGNSRQEESRKMFVFSYFCQGINFKDLCGLTWRENIHDGRVVYRRNKTGKLFSVNINGHLREILDWCTENKNILGYVFNVYNDRERHSTPGGKKDRRNSRAKALNTDLRRTVVELGIVKLDQEETLQFRLYTSQRKSAPVKLDHINYYAARHTYATVLKKSGINTSLISEALGHSTEQITQTYLASFEHERLDEAQKRLEGD
jgi:integrase/recombinase XerD